MSTHPTILGDMIRNEAEGDEKTSLDVERDLGMPGDSTKTEAPQGDDSPGLDRQPGAGSARKQSE